MGGTEGARGGREGGSDDVRQGRGEGEYNVGGTEGARGGREGGREGGSDDVRQRGSGSGGREGRLREG